jgi:competence protein ComEC
MSTPRPLFWLSLAFLCGIGIAGAVTLPISIWLAMAVSALALGLLWRFLVQSLDMASAGTWITSGTLFLIFLCLGSIRYEAARPDFGAYDLAWYNDRDYDVLITGWVTELPDLRDTYTNLSIRVTGLDTGGGTDLTVNGLLLARVDPDQTYHYGEVIRLRGRLKTPPENEDFSYRDYLARQGVHSYMTKTDVTILPGNGGNFLEAGMFALKSRALDITYRLFPDPEASLLAGILLGVDNGLTDDLQQAFKDTGTSHIIAISGFNISIIAAIFLSLFGRVFGPRRGAFFAAVGIIFYTLLVGAEAAVVRAAVMGVVALFARHFGRRQDGLNTLFLAAAGMALFNPFYLQDVGFQLSFAATLGLVLYAEPLSQFATRLLTKINLPQSTVEKISGPISDFFLLTLAAQITTLPIMAYQFNRLSLVSFIANPFILPVQPAVMILGGLADILGMIFLPLGQIAAFIAWPFVTYTIRMVNFFAGVPGAAVSVDFPLTYVIAWYAALLALTFGWVQITDFFQTLRGRFPRIPVWAVISTLTILAVLIWRAALATPDGKLHITFLDAGSSDAILIQTPNGGTVLVNGGESLTLLSSQLGERLPLFHREVDWLIVASTREEEVTALPRLMDRYPPGQVLWAGNVEASYSARTLDQWLTSHEVRVTRAEKDQVLDLGGGATLTVLTSGPRGAVLLIEYRDFRALLPVGSSFDTLTELNSGETVGEVNVLLLGDSGYAQVNPPEWINFLNPQLTILSVAAGDINGLPPLETLEALGERALLRTDANGWIEVSSDGQQMWVQVQRGGPATPIPTITPTPTETLPATVPPATEPPVLETPVP